MVTGVLMDESTTLSYADLCEVLHIGDDLLNELLAHGLVNQTMSFNLSMVQRIQTAHRLQTDLGLNSPGSVLVLELLDELQALRDEVSILRRHVG